MKFSVWILPLLLSISIAHAGDCCCFEVEECCLPTTRIEGRVAAFFPESGRFREIYGAVAPYYQLELTWPTCQSWMGFANVAYFCKDGRSVPLRDKTTITIVPATLGFKYACFFPKGIETYIGVGASYAWVRTKDRSSFVKSSITKNGFGAVLKFGLAKSYDWFYCSAFFDYQWLIVSSSRCWNVGGPMVGASIGVEF